MSSDAAGTQALVRALGAAGYLVKSANRDEIIAAIRRAATGDMLWSREGLRRVAGALSTPRATIDLRSS